MERLDEVNQELREAAEALVLANRRYVAAIELRIAVQKEMREEWNGQENQL
jgi:hypothetical protein